MNCDVQSLLNASACFRCIPRMFRREVALYLWCQIANQGSVVSQRWANQVVANGGAAPSAKSISVLAAFYTRLSLSGLLPKMIAVCCFVPDNLTAALTPIIVGPGNALWTPHGAVAESDLSVNGLATDGATYYFDTGVVPSTAFANDTSAGVSLYNIQGFNELTIDFGCSNVTSTQVWQLSISSAPSNAVFDCWNSTPGQGRISVANAIWRGFLSGSRTGAAATNLYRASSTVPFANIATGNTTGGSRPALSAYLAAFNLNGAAVAFSVRTFSFAAIHLGLSDADTQSLYNCVQAMRVALGGGFV